MKYQLIVTVELSDETAAFLDKSQMGGAAGAAVNVVKTALYNSPFKRVSVDVVEGTESPESDGDEIVLPQGGPDTPKGRTGLTDRQLARALPSVKVVRTEEPDGDAPARTGRPKTLEGYFASDGEPVREWGPRGIQELRQRGVKVTRTPPGQKDQPAKPEKKLAKSAGVTLRSRA